MKKKIMISFLMIVMLFSTLLLSTVDASSYQSRPNATYVNTTANNFAVNIRKMEAVGGTLGMEATIDGTTLLQTNAANGLDVHMIKNTEWGTEMLTLSAYGSSKSTKTESSTGNASGIYQLTGYVVPNTCSRFYDFEYTAGIADGQTGSNISVLANADSRYVNKYGTDVTNIRGDGHGIRSPGTHGNSNNLIFYRGGGNATCDIKYGGSSNGVSELRNGTTALYYFYSRACLVIGERTLICKV